MGDYENLVEMGFDGRRVKIALAKTGGLQDAITWLDENSETPIDDLEAKFGGSSSGAKAASGGDANGEEVEEDQAQLAMDAKSLKCTDCGKLFSTPERAQFHAIKSDHQNFEESSEVVAPLTAEEKATKLAEMRAKLAEKRAREKLVDVETARANEKIRRTKDADTERLKEELKKKEQLKEIEAKRKEKAADIAARKKIEAQIKATQEERKRKQAEAKAEREGKSIPQAAPVPSAGLPTMSANYDQARLQLRIPGRPPLVKSFPAETTLFEVSQAIQDETGFEANSFTMTIPRKTFTREDYGISLKEAKLVPSAALIIG